MRSLVLAAVVFAACTEYGSQAVEEPPAVPDDASIDGGVDAPTDANVAIDAPPSGDAGTDADAGSDIPFEQHLVLRLETDAPDGLENNVWRDLSKSAHVVTVAVGTPTVEVLPSQAKVMVFGAGGPIFDVADKADLQFGATDDFFIVARTTITAPNETSGCTFRYLVSKYSANGLVTPTLRACNANFSREMTGMLKFGVTTEATVQYPGSLETTYGVLSFGRNASGTRIETYAGGASFERTVTPVDVSAVGNAFVVGGYRSSGTGGASGPWFGKVNRLYVFHAPGGTFTKSDYDTIRGYVATAKPIP